MQWEQLMLKLKSLDSFKAEVAGVLKLWEAESTRDFAVQSYDRHVLSGVSIERDFRFLTLPQFEEKFKCRPSDLGLPVEYLPLGGADSPASKAVPGVLLREDDSQGLRVRGFYTLEGSLATSVFDGAQQLRAKQAEEIAAWYEADWRKTMPKSLGKFPSELTHLSAVPKLVDEWRAAEQQRQQDLKEKQEAEQKLLVPVPSPAKPEAEAPEAPEETSSSDSEGWSCTSHPACCMVRPRGNPRRLAKGEGRAKGKAKKRRRRRRQRRRSSATHTHQNLEPRLGLLGLHRRQQVGPLMDRA